MDTNLFWLIVAMAINITGIIGAAYGKNLKLIIILSGLAMVWFGFSWQSWVGAIGAYVISLLIVGILRSTVLKKSLDKRAAS